MFSGIVQFIGTVRAAVSDVIDVQASGLAESSSRIKLGDSIAVNGVCLTVTAHQGDQVSFDISTETRRRTNLGALSSGSEVNIELSLRVGDPIAGHFVLGHVDAVGEVLRREDEGNTIRLVISLPNETRGLIVPKGSVAVDGVSLTVGEVTSESFSVYLVPHTVAATTFQSFAVGRKVNIEADCLARYAQFASQPYRERESGK